MKPYVHVVLPSWIYRLFLISLRRLNFQNAPLVRKKKGNPWFANRTWLHYDEPKDLAYCHVCMVAYRGRKLNSSNLDKAFIVSGFSNWKDASVAFKKTTLPGVIVIR